MDISYDSAFSLRTRLWVPSGALSSSSTSSSGHVVVRPYPSALTPGLISPFQSTVLSTPFVCSSSLFEATGSGALTINFTLQGSIDTQKYSGTSNAPVSNQLSYPCDLQETWQFLNIPGGAVEGSVAIQQYQMVITAGPSQGFPSYGSGPNNNGAIDGTRSLIPFSVTTLGSSDYCICSNITASSDPTEVGKSLCIRAKPNYAFIYYSTNQETPTGSSYPVTGIPYWPLAESQCPTLGVYNPVPGSIGGYGSTSGEISGIPTNLLPTDPCAVQQAASSTQIAYTDVCLGKYTSPARYITSASGNAAVDASQAGEWTCVENYNELQTLPTWSSATGRPRNRVEGRVAVCDDQTVYAFIYSPLLPLPTQAPAGKSAWEQWGKIVLAVSVPLLFLRSVDP